ncbi:hypothetical protein JCM18899A_23000 [Nocardioides sp. AN3]
MVDVRMPYYRGLGLSMVEGVDLTVDGVAVPAEATTFAVHGNGYRMIELPDVLDDRWEMGEPAQIGFTLGKPLATGDHEVTAVVRLRISYMPVPGGGRDTKTLVLA